MELLKKKVKSRIGILCIFMLLLVIFSACGTETGETAPVTDTKEVAKDYYLELTELGMNLTVYLRLEENGKFMFSNTLAFEVNKSAGTFKRSGEEYIMIFDSVNGEEKKASDGLTAAFVLKGDGSLDFSGCERVYYGSASIVTTAENNQNAKLVAIPVPENFEEPDTDTAFTVGSYQAKDIKKGGVTYSHTVSFFEDNSYLHVIRFQKGKRVGFCYESGTYGVSTTTLALEPENGERAECQVKGAKKLELSVAAQPEAEERTSMVFKKVSSVAKAVEFAGEGTVTGVGEKFAVSLLVYEDGSYQAVADGFTEKGILLLDTARAYVKQYPDHPDTQKRGLNQVTTVPYGSCSFTDNEKLVLSDLRIRNSEGLTRYKTEVIQK